jgi:hypothetical protein
MKVKQVNIRNRIQARSYLESLYRKPADNQSKIISELIDWLMSENEELDKRLKKLEDLSNQKEGE